MNEYTTGATLGIGFVAAANGLLVFTCTVAIMVTTGLIVRYLPKIAAWNRRRRVWKTKPFVITPARRDIIDRVVAKNEPIIVGRDMRPMDGAA